MAGLHVLERQVEGHVHDSLSQGLDPAFTQGYQGKPADLAPPVGQLNFGRHPLALLGIHQVVEGVEKGDGELAVDLVVHRSMNLEVSEDHGLPALQQTGLQLGAQIGQRRELLAQHQVAAFQTARGKGGTLIFVRRYRFHGFRGCGVLGKGWPRRFGNPEVGRG